MDKLTALSSEQPAEFHVKIQDKDVVNLGKISFEPSPLEDKIKTNEELYFSENLPFTIETSLCPCFKFDKKKYPDTEDPNLDGLPVLIIKVEGATGKIAYFFINRLEVEKLKELWEHQAIIYKRERK